MLIYSTEHDSARAQTFLSRVREGRRCLTLSLSCPLSSSHPVPWQLYHRSWGWGEPQKCFERSGTQALKLRLASNRSPGKALDPHLSSLPHHPASISRPQSQSQSTSLLTSQGQLITL